MIIGIAGWSTATTLNATTQTDSQDWTVTFNSGTITKSNIVQNLNLVELEDNAENIVSVDNTADLIYYSLPEGITYNGNRFAIDLLINLNLISCSTAPEAVFMYRDSGGNYAAITAFSDDGEFPEINVLSNGMAKTLFGFTEVETGNFVVSGKKLEVIS